MKTTTKTGTGTWGAGAIRAAAMAAVMAAATGCAALDSVDRQLGRWGVVDARIPAGIDTLAVVAIEAGESRGAGVILENGLVFTACHVVAGKTHAVVRTCSYFSDSGYQVLTGRVVYRNAETDQALLAVEETTDLEYRAATGSPKPGEAVVTPMRPCGKSYCGEAVCKPVVRRVVVGSTGTRFGGGAGLAKGDSGCPIVQDGVVVGLVRGDGRMVAADVMANYLASCAPARSRASEAAPARDPALDKVSAPALCAKDGSCTRS